MQSSRLSGIKMLHFPKFLDERGNLSFLQVDDHIPFDLQRVYLIYDVPGGEIRGGNAFVNQEEIIIALSGSFDVVVKDGLREIKYTLNRSYYGLYIPNMVWRHFENFSTNSLAILIANKAYEENEYVRDFNQYQKMQHDL
jgi:dTDP-4-dehydrorhamnose 3,5-epimerase-like enzyme